jgi:hypothetical protein
MADPILRNPSCFIGGVHVFEAQTSDIELDSNAQQAIGDGMVLGATQAPKTGKMSVKKWNQVGGSAAHTKILDAFLNDKIVTFDYGPDSGNFWKFKVRITTYKSTGDTSKGSCEGDISMMMVGKPERS